MPITPGEVQGSNDKNDWQAIRRRMNERRIDPKRLSYSTGYSEDRIRRGIGGEPVPIPLPFLRQCVRVFGLVSARGQFSEDPIDSMSYDECIRLIKPPPAMPPLNANFWESDD